MTNPPMANASSSPPITRSANRLLVSMGCVVLKIIANSDFALSGVFICVPPAKAQLAAARSTVDTIDLRSATLARARRDLVAGIEMPIL